MESQFDIAIIGGGPAGLSAALVAAQLGAQIILIDAYHKPGGQYYRQPSVNEVEYPTRHQREGRKLWENVLDSGVTILPNTQVWNATSDKTIFFSGPEGVKSLQSRAVILATGAYERSIAFPGWTLPGVIMTGGVQTLLSQGVLPGRKVLLAGTGPLQLLVAKKLVKAGSEVVAVLEGSHQMIRRGLHHVVRIYGQWERLGEFISALMVLLQRRIPYRLNWGIVSAVGKDEVEGAVIAQYDEHWRPILGSERKVPCDTICINYGFLPFTTVGRLMGARHAWDVKIGMELPERDGTMQTSLPGVFSVGDGANLAGYRLSVIEGQIAGIAAAKQLGYKKPTTDNTWLKLMKSLQHERKFLQLYSELFTPGPGLYELIREDTPLCRCEGITMKDLLQAVQMGANSIMEIKAFTRIGMGECQGRNCIPQINILAAKLTGRTSSEVGMNSARPPVFPIPVQSLLIEEKT